ncbi:tetratricopeptide repeat protein [Daejeonella sp.]|uniref:tetratricopeptide repeat protein n=1 Tax=Daejeonella sp. TaxID=2805397 RepID=UPI002731F012|nr:tetratricopeptide repeat protein [Daejeonella sp.]MDP2413873.1 tetratricopeptide repeat protein [Daejeonella sp.]
MLRQYAIFTLLLTLFAAPLLAQNTAWIEINQFYKGGIELLDQGKYAAASQQFSRVGQFEQTSSARPESNPDLSLLKENTQFYIALCALELDNSDAESLFIDFIDKYPASNYTKLAYYHLGRSYFTRKNYPKVIEWLTKLEGNNISGKESSEYRYKLAYSYFEIKDNDKAKPIFAELRNEKSTYNELSIYYYAYISYLQKDYKTALTEFERLKGSKPYESSYPYYISAMYFLDQRYDDVLNYAIPILKSTKQLYETEMFRIVGASFFAKSDYTNAGVYYRSFQKNDQGKTQNNQDNYQIGYTWYKLKDYKNAIIELEKLETTDQYFQSGMIALGESFLKTGNKQGARSAFFKASRLSFDKKLQEEGLFNYAKLSYELDFHQVALDATQQFIKTYSYSDKLDEAKILLGEILLTTKNYKDAIDILESIQNRNKEANAVYQKVTYFRGLEYYNERAFQNGISMFMRSNTNVIDNEIHALSTYWLAEAMYEVRKFGESVDNFEKFMNLPAAKRTDVYNFAHYALAYAAFEHESYRKAATYFKRFLQGNEKDINTINDAVLRLADSYFVLKDYDDALGYYDRIISYKTSSEDYAMFQRGMIQGLQGQNDLKITTHQLLLQQFPKSNYSDDAGFEIAYTYFIKGDYEIAKTDLSVLIEKYPRSSYVPRALFTIGLVELNQDQEESALVTFKRVISEYSTTDEAKLALESIKNIYLQRSDAAGFLDYANSTSIGNLSSYEQDNITFQAANNRFLNADYQGTFESVNAYFDKFPKAVHDKHAKFIRAESLVRLKRPDEAIADYEYILNDWTSDYTERALMSIARIYIAQKKYNEAIVHLKKLELTSEYKSNYNFAVNNLMEAYASMNLPDETLKYVKFIRESEKSSEEDIFRAGLYAGKANLAIGDTIQAVKEIEAIVDSTQTVTGAEAKYIMAELQYKKRDYKKSLATAFDLTNKMPSHDYWVAKTYILIADNYVAMKDIFQAKSTLQSIIENYENKEDDILTLATEKLDLLNKRTK